MSIIVSKDNIGWVVDHEEFIKKVYCSVIYEHSSSCHRALSFNKHLFEILTPFLNNLEAKNASDKKSRRKRKYIALESQINSKEISVIKLALKELKNAQKESTFQATPSFEDLEKNNEEARKCASSYYSKIFQKDILYFNGGNNFYKPIIARIKEDNFLIPNNSVFFCSDINKLITSLPENSKFDFILMDPPWWNKYVRRRKKNQEAAGYKMMYNDEVCALPVAQWLRPGALVAVWCTNCERHIQDVVSRWFPKWGLHLVATWFWLKVTRSGEPVCQFSPPPGKQPYERILFGSVAGRTVPQPLDNQCIVSVPSSIHSHKPPLVEVIKPFLPAEPKCLELFARYLLPDWTSAGDQVLSLQNIKLYTDVEHDDL
ncbi:N(6)-adenine-specific methyltransferase METTL4 [Macrosteles quadrilineatus]|uniref:N(6)-adenine-specific methyltransferase METTL4 n=1 Tax=Macrosteles quadrilineatus TaxID=74068 RepID=UPI0023E1DDA8|nr:N(6)-adenine-specific methyltransferase METTL4 [Macrosteles quadrilineatus]XP_054263800.1 N(6)-adenine-specific methyltransferase METTL4 [Macrosteles quadrilineatus]XP_054263801.1 N(6)-adenine-specific methyltransferase METTL4 [Macrosteles quadrilineatus]